MYKKLIYQVAALFLLSHAHAADFNLALVQFMIPGNVQNGASLLVEMSFEHAQKRVFQIDTGAPGNYLYVASTDSKNQFSATETFDDKRIHDDAGAFLKAIRFQYYNVPDSAPRSLSGVIGAEFFLDQCSHFDIDLGKLRVGPKGQPCRVPKSVAFKSLYVDDDRVGIFLQHDMYQKKLKLLLDTGAANQELVIFDVNYFETLRTNKISRNRYWAWGKLIECEFKKLDEPHRDLFLSAEICRDNDGLVRLKGYDGLLGIAALLRTKKEFWLDLVANKLYYY
jgi:hypothetical protein